MIHNGIVFHRLFRHNAKSLPANIWGVFFVHIAVVWALISGCQNNVSLFERYFVTTTYAAILFWEQIFDKRYNVGFSALGAVIENTRGPL